MAASRIRHPDDPNKVVTRIPLADSAMSTSGDYERYFDENGVRYHHIIDPRTGHSASKVRSATIIGADRDPDRWHVEDRLRARARSKALEIINRMPEYDAVFVTPDGRMLYSNGLRPPALRARPAGAAAGAYCGEPPCAALSSASTSRLGGQPVLGLVAGRKPAPLGAQVSALGDHRAARLTRHGDARCAVLRVRPGWLAAVARFVRA